MAEVVEMVQLSPTMEEGHLVEWLKQEGDTIEAGDLIAEVETDKASMEMESYFDGVLLKIIEPAGKSVGVGTPLAVIGEEGEDIEALLEELASKSTDESASDTAPPDAADDGAGGDEATTKDKTDSADDPSAKSGNTTDESADSVEAESKRRRSSADGDRLLISPAARNLAEAHSIDPRQLSGSGPAGRIVKRDVQEAIDNGVAAPAETDAPRASSAAVPRAEDEKVPLRPMRKSIAKNLSEAWKAPAFMLTRSIQMDAAMALRKEINTGLSAAEIDAKISVNDVILKACGAALRDFPDMNVSWGGDHIVRHANADIGFAVALDGGLITPIVRNVEQIPLRQLSTQTRDLAERARAKKLEADEYTGASFSVSNLGSFGIDHFTAVLNPPGAGILAVGAIRQEPRYNDDGELTKTLQMSVTLTCDHRAVDGAIGAQFLQKLAAYLESPLLMVV